jgi:hypothetical protein
VGENAGQEDIPQLSSLWDHELDAGASKVSRASRATARPFSLAILGCIAVMTFIGGATLAGLAAIHFVWLNPAVIGPLALPIGMTPLVLLFQYSFEIPGFFFYLGAFLAIASWFLVRRNPPSFPFVAAVLFGGGFFVFVCVVVFVLASAYYNVGMAGEIPAGWYLWVRPGCRAGGLGLVLFIVGLLLMATSRSGGGSRRREWPGHRRSAE